MLAIAKHAWLRARSTVTAPSDLALLIFAALSSFVVWPVVFIFSSRLTLLEPSQARPFSLAFLILTLWLGAWAIARPVQGRSTGGEARPLPALPIGWLGRAVGEVVAGLVLVLAFRTLTVTVVGWRFFGFAHFSRWGLDFAGSNSLIDGLARRLLAGWRLEHVALVSLLLFPVMLAWLAPARTQTTLSTRSLLVATLAACMPTGLLESGSRQPFVPILAATIGIVLLSLLAMVDFDAGSALRPGVRKAPGPLTRPGIDPERRFRRDRWEPQLRSLLLLVAPAFVLLLGGLLLFLHTTRWRIVYPLCIGLALGLLARFYSTPLGVDAFATDRHGGSRSLVGGAYARAWASLPVRPEAVVRAAYLHGLASASIVWLLWTGHGLVAGALGRRLWDSERDLPLLLAIPIAAGLLLCASVGDHFKGMLSALALASFLPAHLFTLTLPSALSGVEWTPDEIAVLNLGVLLGLAAVGGLPPSVTWGVASGSQQTIRDRIHPMVTHTIPAGEHVPTADQRVVTYGVPWSHYEAQLALRGEAPVPRIAFLEGALELMSPSKDHERIKSYIGRLIETYALERGIDLSPYGAWTLKSAPKAGGLEPDECYIVGSDQSKPAPDLAIEVAWTTGGIDKLEIYRRLGIGEVWIWKDQRIEVHVLDIADGYRRAEWSRLLPDLDVARLCSYLDYPTAMQAVRAFRDALRG